jgi:DNA-binding response OmpR family regulator
MYKILLVEDDQLLSSIMADHFRSAGHEVLCAFDGQSGIDKTRDWDADVMVLDILLPIKDGFAVLEEIRATEKGAKLPVIVMSNLSDEKSIARMRELGVTQYLVKAHATPQSLMKEMQAALG